MTGEPEVMRTPQAWRAGVVQAVSDGARFAGLYGTTTSNGCRVSALLAEPSGFRAVRVEIEPDRAGRLSYPSLTPMVPSAFWYERAARDLSGLEPIGHPRPDPLLLPVDAQGQRPRPGHQGEPGYVPAVRPVALAAPPDVTGRGVFSVSFGPVRSGVTESIDFLLETPGEDIPHLNIRPHYKHRGVAKKFEGQGVDDGVLVAERVEGIASVAHALAFSHAVEQVAGADVPVRAGLVRVVHAELERIANHLDVAMRLADAAGLAVANSRFAWHKESVMRLRSALCGSRFGRGVVVPGGVSQDLRLPPGDAAGRLREIHGRVLADARLAMSTPSFLDRLRGTGRLAPQHARRWGALGPVGRASGFVDDNRWTRPTDGYTALLDGLSPAQSDGTDVMARLRVRWAEIDTSVELAVRALERLAQAGPTLRVDIELPSGPAFGLGWAEAPQGEALHAVELNSGRVVRCLARSASLHNLVLFHDVFHGDVFTDFAFNEASFGLSYAGVAM